MLNAADYGVPQLRHRVVIVGFRKDVNAHWTFPQATHSKEALLYSKWISGDYWERHSLVRPKENPLSIQAQKHLRKVIEEQIGRLHLGRPRGTLLAISLTREVKQPEIMTIIFFEGEQRFIQAILEVC